MFHRELIKTPIMGPRLALPRIALLVTLLFGNVHALDDGSAPFYESVTAADHSSAQNAMAFQVLLTSYVNTSGARCLDGSPGNYYFRQGTGDGALKWYIHHQGGGWCENMDDCLSRSRGHLGSSQHDGKTMQLRGGYFDPSPAVNPMMHDWNVVFMRYCDGGSFSGNNETAPLYKNTTLYFRGKRIREAVYDSLKALHRMGAATDVVISGCSAGGLATFLHTDQWCDALARDAPGVKCVGLPDSGFFLDFEDARRVKHAGGGGRQLDTISGNYHSGLKWVFEMMNTSAGLNQDCVAAKASGGASVDAATYLCQFAEHTSVFTHTPLFALQSEYDSWQTGHVLYYPNTGADVAALGRNLTQRITANLLGPHPRSGVFLDSCWHHCGMWDQIRIDGELVSTAFQKWYEGLGARGEDVPIKRTWKQGLPFRCYGCCYPDERAAEGKLAWEVSRSSTELARSVA